MREAGPRPCAATCGDAGALERGARGADVAFHSAARLGDFGPWKEFRRVNVDGTKAVIAACRAAGVSGSSTSAPRRR